MKVVLVHGSRFNNLNNNRTKIETLIPYLLDKGLTVEVFKYDISSMFGIATFNSESSDELISKVNNDDIVIVFSNGCTITARAIDNGLKASHVIFIHPAVKAEWEPHSIYLSELHVYYSYMDHKGYLALLQRFFSPFNLIFGKTYYGQMMTVGSSSCDERITNYPSKTKHVDIFKDRNCVRYIKSIKGVLNE